MPFKCINSAVCGEDSSVIVLPPLSVKETLLKVSQNSDSWSFAVPEARMVTLVLPWNTGPLEDPFVELEPHAVVNTGRATAERMKLAGKCKMLDKNLGSPS